MPRQVWVDRSACGSCRVCTDIAPNTFALDEEHELSYVVNPGGDPGNVIQDAIDSCPELCIHWVDEWDGIDPSQVSYPQPITPP